MYDGCVTWSRLWGADWGANSSLGSVWECIPLGKVVGNLAQAKTDSTQDPFVFKSSVTNMSPFVSTAVIV